MTRAKETFKEKVEKRRQKCWTDFAENDLARNPWGVVYKLASEKFKTRGILQSFQTNEDDNITRDFRSTLEFLLTNLLPDDDPDINNVEQRITQSDYRTTTAEVGSDVVITDEEVNIFVSQIQNKKAPSLDNLKGKILKRLHPKITPLITRIYNACWNLNYFPTTWKKGNLVVLLKDPKASHSNIKNYRPITLLPEHGKILEKTVRKKLEEELSPLHSPRQFGFVKGRSTSDALHLLVSTIRDCQAKYVATIFFDIKGAFDNLWWPSLIKTLRNRGASSKLTAMIKSYLTDRVVQFTQGDVTVRKLCSKGCPQGSVLGPTLWNLIMDTLLDSEWPDFATPIAYADDLAVVVKSDLRSHLKLRLTQVIDKITDWATRNKLSVSETKTKFMIHKCPSRSHHRDLDIRVYGSKISLVKTQLYLGIMLDSKLHFESHATHTAKKVRQITMSLYHATPCVNYRLDLTWIKNEVLQSHVDDLMSLLDERFSTIDPIPEIENTTKELYSGFAEIFLKHGKKRKNFVARPDWWNEELERFRKIYLAKKTLFYRNRFREYSDHLFAEMTRAKQTFKEKVEKRRQKCWLEFAENDLARNTWRVVYKLASEKFKTRGILQSFQTDEDDNITREFQSTMEFLITNLLPDDDPDANTEEQRVTESDFRTTTAEVGSEEEEVLTGHGNFGIHQLRHGKSENSKLCPNCPDFDDDPVYRILEGLLFGEVQERIRGITGTWPPDLTQVPFIDNDEVFSALALDLTPPPRMMTQSTRFWSTTCSQTHKTDWEITRI
ncbi:hypothetical protein TcasGA2_TC031590 [Tribolium castaneum]|uniref:Reverse transcriptase domain-containing protein n=1 Tax=Tribolium castaneum TaxID=7070 RepID=A0A139WA45_TRICA|nr:hypothetical protein TcasGA2_TC031590 [Tribolium castaneum]